MSSTASHERRLPLAKRLDLEFAPQREGIAERWAVKDPVKLEYYHLGPQEMYLLEQLDGTPSLMDLKRKFDARFAPRRITSHELQTFLRKLHEFGLVVSDAEGQGRLLFRRARAHRLRALGLGLLNPLAIRFPGFNATVLLQWLDPVGRLLFRGATLALVFVLTLLAAGFMAARYDTFVSFSEDMARFQAARGVLGLMFTLGVVKVLHELGHGMACRRFGGECREIGAMLLVGMPCLYCNVSDAWMFTSRWRRIAVSLAGIYVEWIVALLAFFVWLITVPGTVHVFAWNIVIVCSVSTLVFNANPLLRYDGYYLLADLMQIPNLAEQSRDALWGPLERWLSGSEEPVPDLDGPRAFLVCYGLLSTAFRLFLTVLIAWTLYRWFRGQHVQALGDVLVLSIGCGMALPWGYGIMRLLRRVQAGNSVRWGRWLVFMGIATTFLLGILWIPVPRYIKAQAVVEWAGAAYLRAPYDGQLIDSLPEGTAVTRGTPVFTLENLQLLRELEEAAGEVRLLQSRLAAWQRRASGDTSAANQVATAAAAVAAAEERLASLQEKAQRMVVRAPKDGVVMPAPNVAGPGDSEDQLPEWTGSPLTPENRGCFLRAGQLVCLVGSPDQMEVLVRIGQLDVDLVAPGARVYLYLDQHPGARFLGQVVEVSKGQVPVMPNSWNTRASNAANNVANSISSETITTPETTYYARIRFSDKSPRVSHGSFGLAKIQSHSDSLGARWMRFLKQTIAIQLSVAER